MVEWPSSSGLRLPGKRESVNRNHHFTNQPLALRFAPSSTSDIRGTSTDNWVLRAGTGVAALLTDETPVLVGNQRPKFQTRGTVGTTKQEDGIGHGARPPFLPLACTGAGIPSRASFAARSEEGSDIPHSGCLPSYSRMSSLGRLYISCIDSDFRIFRPGHETQFITHPR